MRRKQLKRRPLTNEYVPRRGDRVYFVYDSTMVGTVGDAGVEQSEVIWDDACGRGFYPNAQLRQEI